MLFLAVCNSRSVEQNQKMEIKCGNLFPFECLKMGSLPVKALAGLEMEAIVISAIISEISKLHLSE